MPHGHSARLTQFGYRGAWRYSLTLCTHGRHRAFVSPEVIDLALCGIRKHAAVEGFAILAYCFMPDHLHLLVAGEVADADLVRFVARAKQATAHMYAAMRHRRLWQHGYYERVLRSEEVVTDACRYIWDNPVRDGLVATADAYPYSGSDVYEFPTVLDEFILGER